MTVMPDKPADGPVRLKWRAYPYNAEPVASNGSSWEQLQRTQLVAVVWQREDMEKLQVELGTPYYYSDGTFVGRCWDSTLYLRKLGVKFGRWADPALFQAAWKDAIRSCTAAGTDVDTLFERCKQGGQFVASHDAETMARPAWWVYYEDRQLFSADEHTWAEIPTDGVLCACYSYIKDNLLVATAKRRYTFYFWRGDVLENTDDLEAVLAAFPQFKRGLTSFDALRASQPMAELIRDALNDTLEDVPWPT